MFSKRDSFASASDSEGAFSRPRTLATKGKQNERGAHTLMIALGICLCVLVLAGGSYWFSDAHDSTSTTSHPAVAPTQVAYTLASSAPTTAPTATARATTVVRVTATVTPSPSPTTASTLSPVPSPWATTSPLIVVSIAKQRLTAYSDGKARLTTLVTTGMPALYTPKQVYHIIGRIANAMFTSPWPKGSLYYYAPIHVNYGLQLTASGIYLHDATWRSEFGPGTNVPHKDPVYGQETGSHGCIELPLSAMRWLYRWAPNGIVVDVVN